MSRLALWTTLLVFILDQATKSWMSGRLASVETVPVVPGLLHLTLVHNRGGAFGLLPGASALFVAAGLLAALGILVLARRLEGLGPWSAVALGLILGGAAGNLVDRVRFGHVTDFVDLRYAGRNVWPVFNLADSCITIGGVILAWALLKPRSRPAERSPAATPAPE